MGDLRSNSSKKQDVKDKTKALFSELLDCEEDYAIGLIDWFLEKTKTNKKHIRELDIRQELKLLKDKTDQDSKSKVNQLKKELKKVLPDNYPNDLKKGDIVHLNFGKGYGAEISDGHYAIILARKGSNFFIAPLTKVRQPDGSNTVSLEDLGLPGGVQKGYVNFGQFKFVHYRRIENVKGLTERKNVSDKVTVIMKSFNAIIEEE